MQLFYVKAASYAINKISQFNKIKLCDYRLYHKKRQPRLPFKWIRFIRFLEAVTHTCIGQNWINLNISRRTDELTMRIIANGNSCVTF